MTALWLLLCSLLFVRESENANIIILITLALFIVAARPLSRSIASEIQGREDNEHMAADLKAANDRLQDLDRTKSEFVSIASHQLRTPLTAIRGFAELMRDGSYGPIPDKFLEPLAHIEESVQNMAMTINDFLNVSRIESGTMQYDPTIFSLHELTERIWGELKQYAEKRNLRLLFEPKTFSPLMVEADEGKVRQILQNLIDNSIKYTPDGTVTIELELLAGNLATVSIVDTGIGMSLDTQKIIFDKFVRASNANTVNIYGTGLGLYIAKEMAEAMHGRVTASSWGEGQGSTFTLTLPLTDKKAPLPK
jgi:signal transduction histidine kinase